MNRNLNSGVDGPPSGREAEIAWVLRSLHKRTVRNVVWLTADVHYTAAHRYSPAGVGFTEFGNRAVTLTETVRPQVVGVGIVLHNPKVRDRMIRGILMPRSESTPPVRSGTAPM